MRISVKNNADAIIFYTAICFRAEQIATMAEEKSAVRIFLSLFAAKLLRNED